MTPTPSSVARAREIVEQYISDNPATTFFGDLDLITAIALALDVQREADAKVADARALRKPERFELGLTHNTRCEEADIIAAAIREGKD